MILRSITASEADMILQKNSLTRQDRFKLDSFTAISLTDYCGNIRPNEQLKVQRLEENNIYRVLNVLGAVLGMCNNEAYKLAVRMSPLSDMIAELKKTYSGIRLQEALFQVISKVLLSKDPLSGKVSFDGEMPQKFGSFRQFTANEWFQKYVNVKVMTVWHVLTTMGEDDAKGHLLGSTAYALYQSQPSLYDISSFVDEDGAIKYILKSFLARKGSATIDKYNQKGEILYKNL